MAFTKKQWKIYYVANKEKIKERSRLWYYANRNRALKRIKITNKLNYQRDPKKSWDRANKWRKTYAWAKLYQTLYKRCKNSPHYVKLGIKRKIGTKELRQLWFRDKAYLMKKPTIDRIDRLGHYEFLNCRFIELSENLKRRVFNKQKVISSE